MSSERDILHAAASKESNCLPVAALERMAGALGPMRKRPT